MQSGALRRRVQPAFRERAYPMGSPPFALDRALPLSAAFEVEEGARELDAWLARENVRLVRGKDDHWERLTALIGEAAVEGKLTSDTHLAALAMSHGAVLASGDADFHASGTCAGRTRSVREAPAAGPVGQLPASDSCWRPAVLLQRTVQGGAEKKARSCGVLRMDLRRACRALNHD